MKLQQTPGDVSWMPWPDSTSCSFFCTTGELPCLEKVKKMWENCMLATWTRTGWQLRSFPPVGANSPLWNGNINNLYAGEGIIKYRFLSLHIFPTFSSSLECFFPSMFWGWRWVSPGREDLAFPRAKGGSFIDSWNSSASLTSPPLWTRGADLLIRTWTRKFQTPSPCSVDRRQFPPTAALNSSRI